MSDCAPNPFAPGSDTSALSGNVFTVESLPKIIAEALDAADKRREERAMRQAATQNLEAIRQNFAGQLAALERLLGGPPEDSPIGKPDPAILALAEETRDLLAAIDEKLAKDVAANADMIRESIRQAREAVTGRPEPRLELLPGQALVSSKGKRR